MEQTLIKKGSKLIQEYLDTVKSLEEEILLIDHQISEDDLTLYILNGPGSEFCEIVAPICAWESSLSFEGLHDLYIGRDAYLLCLETANQ